MALWLGAGGFTVAGFVFRHFAHKSTVTADMIESAPTVDIHELVETVLESGSTPVVHCSGVVEVRRDERASR